MFVVSLCGFGFVVFARFSFLVAQHYLGLLRFCFLYFCFFLFRVAALIRSRRSPLAFRTRSPPWPVFCAVR
ncbi:hypothetical protein HMPREF3214_00959 [Alloscardovia omnicolens]|nr:hypothetical protein HMPREF3214_00959 [Alloscardovia omnicolens]